MNVIDIAILTTVLGLGVFGAIVRRRALRHPDGTRMSSAAWSLLAELPDDDRPPDSSSPSANPTKTRLPPNDLW
jgi:hypothetical protein